jgi:hypothetical protein
MLTSAAAAAASSPVYPGLVDMLELLTVLASSWPERSVARPISCVFGVGQAAASSTSPPPPTIPPTASAAAAVRAQIDNLRTSRLHAGGAGLASSRH